MQDFLESEYLGEQVESIKELSNYVNTLTRLHGPDGANYALGEYQFDKVTLGGGSKTAAWPAFPVFRGSKMIVIGECDCKLVIF